MCVVLLQVLYFAYNKAVTNERHKSFIKITERYKVCEKCFYCRSLCFCPDCFQYPQYCTSARRSPTKLLADLVPPGCKSKGNLNVEGRLHVPVQNQNSSGKVFLDSQWVCKLPQEPLPDRNFACSDSQEDSRDGKGLNISSLFQQAVHSTKTQKWHPILDLSALNKFLFIKTFKMENPETSRISLQKGEWVTSLDAISTSPYTNDCGNS